MNSTKDALREALSAALPGSKPFSDASAEKIVEAMDQRVYAIIRETAEAAMAQNIEAIMNAPRFSTKGYVPPEPAGKRKVTWESLQDDLRAMIKASQDRPKPPEPEELVAHIPWGLPPLPETPTFQSTPREEGPICREWKKDPDVAELLAALDEYAPGIGERDIDVWDSMALQKLAHRVRFVKAKYA